MLHVLTITKQVFQLIVFVSNPSKLNSARDNKGLNLIADNSLFYYVFQSYAAFNFHTFGKLCLTCLYGTFPYLVTPEIYFIIKQCSQKLQNTPFLKLQMLEFRSTLNVAKMYIFQ